MQGFFRRKLDIYNLTAHTSKEKVGYCEIWHKAMCRQSGNHIVNEAFKFLMKVSSSNPQTTHYTLWSDSCDPQNKNRLIPFAVASFT